MSDIGIIGGADGPTAILVSSELPYWLICAVIVALGTFVTVALIALIVLIVILLNNK